MNTLPTVSILTGTLDPDPLVFRKMLAAVRTQDYPRRLIQHLVIDGGSSIGTVVLAKEYGCRVLSYPKLRSREQVRFSEGFKHATGTLVLILESDNILPSSDWLTRTVEPFIKEKRVTYSYPAYNSYESDSSLLTKYCALMGSPDPTLFYMGKSDKMPIFEAHYDKGTVIKETPRYWMVRFDASNMPTLGDNGFMVRRKALEAAIRREKEYIHVDAFRDLVAMGYDTAGVVKNAIIHLTGQSITAHIRRRVEVKKLFTDEKKSIRTYQIMDWNSPRDRWSLLKYVIFSLTWVQPLLLSMRGFVYKPEPAWFLHPMMCFCMVLAYGWSEMRFWLRQFILPMKG